MLQHGYRGKLYRSVLGLLPETMRGSVDYYLGHHSFFPGGWADERADARLEAVRTLITGLRPDLLVETRTLRATTTEWLAQFGLPVVTAEISPHLHSFSKSPHWRAYECPDLCLEVRSTRYIGLPLKAPAPKARYSSISTAIATSIQRCVRSLSPSLTSVRLSSVSSTTPGRRRCPLFLLRSRPRQRAHDGVPECLRTARLGSVLSDRT